MQPKRKDTSTWIVMKRVPGFPADCTSRFLERVGQGGLSAFSQLLPGVPLAARGTCPFPMSKHRLRLKISAESSIKIWPHLKREYLVKHLLHVF